MYWITDDLLLVAGKRYVSVAICTCVGHVANTGGTSEEQAALLPEVIGQLSTIWAALILWPFYARAHRQSTEPPYDSESGDSTPTARHFMVRDNYWCPICGSFDDDLYDLPAIPPSTLSTILTTEIAAHALKHYFGVDDAIYDELYSPENGFAMSVASRTAFRRFMFCLRPTEVCRTRQTPPLQFFPPTLRHIQKPNCYEFRDERPGLRFADYQHVSDHNTFVDHSTTSPLVQQGAAMFGHSTPEGAADLPSRDLLRLHATLAGVL
ncbi:hypothetical protein LXA43DRAFT_1102505 [Ganoderma leucocontextum]|nr:hypothetical protein LXA43DRAFT_1102505 [Ganoderma leucocontextum]